MTPPSVPQVCRECSKRIFCYYRPAEGIWKEELEYPCAALELLKTVSAPEPEDCVEECLLAERLRKEVG